MVTRIIQVWNYIFKKPFTGYLLENKYRVIPAFKVGGKKYFMYADQMEVPAGRQFAALTIYNEMEMRCSREYLELHCKAMDNILSDPKKIHIGYIGQLNFNLKERLDLMVIPEFIYKLASVVFFDETESPYRYDFEYNEKKIAAWKKDKGATLDFFLSTPLITLVPFLKEQKTVSPIFLKIAEQIDAIHRQHLTDILSGKMQPTG